MSFQAPTLLFRPAIVMRVLVGRLRRGQRGALAPGAGQASLASPGE
ncbi:MAG TPA: hypothetical protein VKE41_06645 [Roseiflexaceae bacterium]|nr:hypothetical protein [Roseiflexaceae bacterium]